MSFVVQTLNRSPTSAILGRANGEYCWGKKEGQTVPFWHGKLLARYAMAPPEGKGGGQMVPFWLARYAVACPQKLKKVNTI